METALDIILFILPILSIPTSIALLSGMQLSYKETDCEQDKKAVKLNILNLKIFSCIISVLVIAALILKMMI